MDAKILSSSAYTVSINTSVDDHRAVTVSGAVDDSQRWDLSPIGTVCSLRHKSSGRFLEATLDGDFQIVTRPQGSDQQTWRLGEP